METPLKKLADLVLRLPGNNADHAALQQEILETLHLAEAALNKLFYYNPDTVSAKKSLEELELLLPGLVFCFDKNKTGNNNHRAKHLVTKADALFKKVNIFLDCYRPPFTENPGAYNLLPLQGFFKTAARVTSLLAERFGTDEVYKILLPHLSMVKKDNALPCHRWRWWVHFFSLVVDQMDNPGFSLHEVLTNLNFNTSAFMQLLHSSLKRQMAGEESAAEKLGYLSNTYIQYKLSQPCHELAYNPGALSVQQAMLVIIKTECKTLYATIPVLNQPVQAAGKVNTALSVPQLALFVRLLIDTKIISNTSPSALLKHIAGSVHTAKTAAISPESLRVNYYTPGNAARNIVKEYLVNMVNHLKTY